MQTIVLLIDILFWLFFAVVLAGMIRPWWVLWFLDVQNRLLVLQYYGRALLLLAVAKMFVVRLV